MSSKKFDFGKLDTGSESEFFDSIFEYLLLKNPTILKDSDGKSRLITYHDKWRREYMKKNSQDTQESSKSENKLKWSRENSVQSPVQSPEEHPRGDCRQFSTPASYGSPKPECEKNDPWLSNHNPGGYSNQTSTLTTSNRFRESKSFSQTTESNTNKRNHDDLGSASLDCTNGASYEKYQWSQSFDDLEVRLPVQSHVLKGVQVKVNLRPKTLSVHMALSALEGGNSVVVVEGPLLHNIRVDESMWSLSPKEYLSINLEKVVPQWWDRLFTTEPGIDLKKAHCERDFNSLPDDEKAKISKIIHNKEMEAKGEMITDNSKAAAMLKEAWDKDGSPFSGQPFDPSIVQMDNSE